MFIESKTIALRLHKLKKTTYPNYKTRVKRG